MLQVLHARKVKIINIIAKKQKHSMRKTSKATVVFGFVFMWFGDDVLQGYLKWSEAQSVFSIARQTWVL